VIPSQKTSLDDPVNEALATWYSVQLPIWTLFRPFFVSALVRACGWCGLPFRHPLVLAVEVDCFDQHWRRILNLLRPSNQLWLP